jgi:hypothetical protein
MNDRVTTVRSRTLATRLHLALKAKNWNVATLCAAMGWSQSKTSRFLSCKRGVNVLDVATMLGHLGVRGRERDEILALAASPYEMSWWHEHADQFPAQLPVVSGQEAVATSITAFHPTLVPALVQTPNYTRALLRAGSVTHPSEIDKHVALLAHRQASIDRKGPPQQRFIVDEFALSQASAEQQVMADQIDRLRQLSNYPHITIQVLPAHSGHLRGYPAFELLSFDDGRPAVYLELLNVSGFLEQSSTVDIFHRAFADLGAAALDEHETHNWLNGRTRTH